MLHQIEKLHKVEDFLGIPVTTRAGNPLMLNGIGYGRVSVKDSGANSLAHDAVGIRYAVALWLGTLLM